MWLENASNEQYSMHKYLVALLGVVPLVARTKGVRIRQ